VYGTNEVADALHKVVIPDAVADPMIPPAS
jgi:hypothetical protein